MKWDSLDDWLRMACRLAIGLTILFLLTPIVVTAVMAFDSRAFLGPSTVLVAGRCRAVAFVAVALAGKGRNGHQRESGEDCGREGDGWEPHNDGINCSLLAKPFMQNCQCFPYC